jgi:hypothetical protein
VTTKVLSKTYPAGYDISPSITILSIASSGYVENAAGSTYSVVTATNSCEVINSGTVTARTFDGIVLRVGGSVINGDTSLSPTISGLYAGIYIESGVGTVTNFGAMVGAANPSYTTFGVLLVAAGGRVTNGAANHTNALIEGTGVAVELKAAGTVANYGTFNGDGATSIGVDLTAGGALTNGASTDTVALIEGANEGALISNAAATVTNFGAIDASATGSKGIFIAEGRSPTAAQRTPPL